MNRVLLLLVIHIFFVSLSQAQTQIVKAKPIKNYVNLPPIAASSTGRYFVGIKGEPIVDIIRANSNGNFDRRFINYSILQEHRIKLAASRTKFKNSLENLSHARGIDFKIRYEYDLLWNGISLEFPEESLAKLKSIDGVVSIHPVEEDSIPEKDFDSVNSEEAVPDSMLPPLNIDQIWSAFGTKGEGITIAIFDTGIDYTHPDLGGCLGPNCKVLGGYDFINNDSDPMDDHMHGTHVAGIAAGNGKKLGAAPNAKLLAYKVLSAGGSGSRDGIMKALEFSIDPNGDGKYDDAPHVMNFSLGGAGHPDDPFAQVVNRASLFSVIAVAAGNGGTSAKIGLPAGAIHALTVAASEGEDKLATFSSVGPTSGFTSKPDIAAPGVAIWSTLPKGAYGQLSGTSMATPQVAGIAALLIQGKGGYSVNNTDVLKARLANTAKLITCPNQCGSSLLNTFMYQGHGLAQPLAAMKDGLGLYVNRLGTPAYSFAKSDFGIQPVADPKIHKFVTIPIAYNFNEPKTFALSFTHDLGAGAAIEVYPKEISFKTAGMKDVILTVRQKTDNVPLNNNYPNSNGILLELKDRNSNKKLNIPISIFPRARYTLVQPTLLFDFGALIAEDGKSRETFRIPSNGITQNVTTDVFLSPLNIAYHELLAGFQGKEIYTLNLLMKEGTSIGKEFTRTVSTTDLTHTKIFTWKDSRGRTKEKSNILGLITSPKVGSTNYRTYFTVSNVRLSTNAISDKWDILITHNGYENERATFAGEKLSFSSPSENVVIPKDGYEGTQLIPKISGIEYPKYICHIFWAGAINNPYVGMFSPSMSDEIYVGKGTGVDSITWEVRFRHDFDDAFSCLRPSNYTRLLLSFLNNGRPALLSGDLNPVASLDKTVEIGNSAPVFSGTSTAKYGAGAQFNVTQITRKWGETQRVGVNYQLTSIPDNMVVLEGTSTYSSPILQASLKPGFYKMTRTFPAVNNPLLQSELVFNVKNLPARGATSTTLPDLKGFYWFDRGNKMEVILAPGASTDSDAQMDQVSLWVKKPADANWQNVPLTPVTGAPKAFRGEFDVAGSASEYEAQVGLKNRIGDANVMRLFHPFALSSD